MTGDLTRTDDLPAPFADAWAGRELALFDVDWYGPREGTALVKAPDPRGACALCATFAGYAGAFDLVQAGRKPSGRPFGTYSGGGYTFTATQIYPKVTP